MAGASSASRTPLVALAAVVIIIGGAFAYYYVQSSGTISSLNQTVTSQASAIASQSAKIANLTSTISSLQSKVSQLQSQVAADEAKITLLTAKNAQANQTIASLNSQISSLNSQISSLQSQINTLQNVVNLKNQVTIVSGKSVTQTPTDLIPTIATYDAPYSGYLLLTGTTDAPNGFFLVDQTIAGTEYSGHFEYGPVESSTGTFGYYVSGGFAVAFPVSAGNFTLYFASNDATYDSATVTVTLVY